jgi:uncharacterized protein (TIGR03086 family)
MTSEAADRANSNDSRTPELLDRAVSYALGNVATVTPALLRRPTPCQGWDLGTLLRHACESLQALHEGIADGRVRLASSPDQLGHGASAGSAFAQRASALLDAWSHARRHHIVVGSCGLAAGVLAGAGALEIAVHGWDVSQACGDERPIPAALARDLSEIARVLVTDTDRGALFAAPVAVAATASPSDRLIAFLGRLPRSRPG